MSSKVQRKLTTILAADAEGYSRHMSVDEVGTFDALHDARGVFARFIDRHNGRIANTAGDGLIAEFSSVVEAVQCAIEVQRELGDRCGDSADPLRFRIGVHLGDVMVDDGDLLGEGVNLAARLQTMAEPGGILISQQVYDQVRSKLSVAFEYLGQKRPKNFVMDVPVYRVSQDKGGSRPARRTRTHRPAHRPESASAGPDAGLRDRVGRHAKLLGIVAVAIFVIDLATGPTFFSHWPAIGMAAALAWQAAPLLARGRLGVWDIRGLAVIGILGIINIVTWSGHLWVFWPALAIVVLGAIRKLGVRSR